MLSEDMEPVSNHIPTSASFPYYELHHNMASHNINATTPPSAMDILCQIVNSEYSDVGFNMAPPTIRAAACGHDGCEGASEKESFLDTLYFSENKAKIVDEDTQHHNSIEQPTAAPSNSSAYNTYFSIPPSSTLPYDQELISSPDMQHFKLPLLEQEPESSINNSQLDEKLKNKEIRRNLERSIVMHYGDNMSQSVAPLAYSKQEERHEICSTFSGNLDRQAGHIKMSTSAKAKAINGKLNISDGATVNAKLLKRKSVVKQAADTSNYAHNKKSKAKHINNCEKRDENAGQYEDNNNKDSTQESNKRRCVESLLAGTAARTLEARVCAETAMTLAVTADVGVPRMTHISVERNRRKQMNEHLAILRSLMPSSYVQRSDQASIIGGVVEFIKELQQLLASLEAQKRRRAYVAEALSPRVSAGSTGMSPRGSLVCSPRSSTQELVATSRSPLADVEVKLAGGAQVLLRALSHRSTRGQLIHLIAALECMSLQILHLNITTLQQAVLYTFTLKIGIECRLSVDDLADVGQQIFKDIHARKLQEI